MDIPKHRLQIVQRWDREFMSLDAPIRRGTEQSLGEVLPDQNTPLLEDAVEHLDLRDKLHKIVDEYLEPGERTYLCVRFGLNGGPVQTLPQAARQLGLTRTHAQRMERRALRELRKKSSLWSFAPTALLMP
jgi:DNA-directed RNA polymerase sigma subunit (sigma70/sigma32)